jgi:hypothetical protein
MRSLRRTRMPGACVVALVALVTLTQPLTFVADAAPRLRPRRASGDDIQATLQSLSVERRSGRPFAVQEVEILDAWEEGLDIAPVEAEVLASRAIYNRYVAGRVVTQSDLDLLARWRAYAAEHAVELQTRNLKLNEGLAQNVAPPDGSEDWRLYSDPEVYNQLSSAFQRRLERKFGRRGKARELRLAEAAETAKVFDTAGPGFPANTLVNDPNADMTSSDTQSETSLVLAGGSTILASYNDSGSSAGGAAHFTGIARSTDAGVTWLDQGVLPASTRGDAGDPVYARNNTNGTIILSTLGFTAGNVLQIFRSTDSGVSYGAPVNGAAGGGSHDKEWVTADNFAGTGQGNFYMFWRNFGFTNGGMTFTRSTDDGVTWVNRTLISANEGQGAWVTVGADHAVYLFWLKAGPNRIVFKKSTDQGVTFGAETPVVTLVTTGTNGDMGLNGGFRSNAFPQVVNHPTNANWMYMAVSDRGAGGDEADVFLTYSTDAGATWAPLDRVNTDMTTSDNWQPVIAITPDGTGLFVSWYDRRGNGAAIDVYGTDGVICNDGSVTFVPEYRISDGSWPVVIAQDPTIVATYMGDYDQAVADNTGYYRTWGDNRLSRLTHTNQPDVRFTKILKSSVTCGGPAGDSIGLNLNGTNTFFLRNSNSSGAADITTFFGGGTFVPVRGDYDGNGTDTIGGYDASSGCFFLRNANTPGPADAIVCFGPGGAGIIPLVGDWDGNGTDTVGIYIEATGTFFLRNSNTPGGADITVNFGPGGAGIVPLTGDWDGNGTDTVGIYLSASGAFFLRNSNTPGGADLVFTFGAGGSVVPLSGDWNNDGTDSIGLFDAGTGAFFLKNMNAGGGADIVFTFGAGGAVTPLTGDWDGL